MLSLRLVCAIIQLSSRRLTPGPDLDERGGDNTVEVLGNINSLTEAEGMYLVFVSCYVT